MGGNKVSKPEVLKSEGQLLVEKMCAFYRRYMFLPGLAAGEVDYALVAAMWALLTWTFDKFDIIPYLVIRARVKGAGKTTFSELIARTSFSPVQWGSATAATMYRMLGEKGGMMSLFCDEMEGLAKESLGALRSVLNIGFRRGSKVSRTGSGGKVEEFPAYCPKCMILIGHVFDTLADRSIFLTLDRGTPEQLSKLADYDMSVADGEAALIVGDPDVPQAGTIRHVLRETPAVMAVRPAFLSGRDRDIWAAMFGLAAALKLDDATVDKLTKAASELSMAKKAPMVAKAESESAALDTAYAEKLLRDMGRIFKAGEKQIFSAEAVTRLKALNDGGWTAYRGVGLDVISLASLLRRHGVIRKSIRMPRVEKGVKAPNANGYTREAVEVAIGRLGGPVASGV